MTKELGPEEAAVIEELIHYKKEAIEEALNATHLSMNTRGELGFIVVDSNGVAKLLERVDDYSLLGITQAKAALKLLRYLGDEAKASPEELESNRRLWENVWAIAQEIADQIATGQALSMEQASMLLNAKRVD